MVFISYSHDSRELERSVKKLSDDLRKSGIRTELDQYHESPEDGWPLWMQNCLDEAVCVLVICTPGYFEKVMRRKQQKGRGKGVKWESLLAYNELYHAEGRTKKYIPIIYNRDHEVCIPPPLAGHTHYFLPTDLAKLKKRLKNELKSSPAAAVEEVVSPGGVAVATTSSDTMVATDYLDVVYRGNFETFDTGKQDAILKGIREFLGADIPIRVVHVRSGSVIIRLALPEDAREILFRAIHDGQLGHLKITDATKVSKKELLAAMAARRRARRRRVRSKMKDKPEEELTRRGWGPRGMRSVKERSKRRKHVRLRVHS